MNVKFLFFKQKTAYDMRISDWSSDVCSSDLLDALRGADQSAGAADIDFAFPGHRIRSAIGAVRREGPGCALLVAREVLGDLRDDVARALDDDAVARPHPQPRDLVGIVERRVGDDDAAHRHGLQPRDRKSTRLNSSHSCATSL